MLNTDDLRHHTEVGTGYSKDAMLEKAADEIDQLRKLASDAFEAWNYDRDSQVGKLLRAMLSNEFRQHYRPELMAPNVELSGLPLTEGENSNEQ